MTEHKWACKWPPFFGKELLAIANSKSICVCGAQTVDISHRYLSSKIMTGASRTSSHEMNKNAIRKQYLTLLQCLTTTIRIVKFILTEPLIDLSSVKYIMIDITISHPLEKGHVSKIFGLTLHILRFSHSLLSKYLIDSIGTFRSLHLLFSNITYSILLKEMPITTLIHNLKRQRRGVDGNTVM